MTAPGRLILLATVSQTAQLAFEQGAAMAKQSNNSADGWATAVGVLIVGLVAVVALVPKQIWIGLGVVAIGAV